MRWEEDHQTQSQESHQIREIGSPVSTSPATPGKKADRKKTGSKWTRSKRQVRTSTGRPSQGQISLLFHPSLPERHNEGSNLYGHLDSCDASSPLDVCHRGHDLPGRPCILPRHLSPLRDNAHQPCKPALLWPLAAWPNGHLPVVPQRMGQPTCDEILPLLGLG